MAADVTVTLENALKNNGNMTIENAKNYVDEMKVKMNLANYLIFLTN